MEAIAVCLAQSLPARRRYHFAAAVVIAALIFFIAWLVYISGGVKFVFPHLMYVPILLAGGCFGLRGGVFAALMGGLVLGPYMPIDTATGEAQQTINWVYRTGFFVLIGILAGVMVNCLRKQLETVRHNAQYDAGTGLPNKTFLLEHLCERTAIETPFALAMVHLTNYFDIVNILGMNVGDRLMGEVVRRVEGALPEAEALCQVHSDKFAIVLPGVDREGALLRLRQMNREMRKSFELDGIPVYVGSAVGVACMPEDDTAPRALIQKANLALEQACRGSAQLEAFDSSRIMVNQQQLLLLGEIPQALAENQFQLYYQPKVELAGGRTVGVEALLRWNHPKHGMVPPADFIPQTEQTGLIHELTRWVLTNALDQLALWTRQGYTQSVAVNISVHNFLEADLFRFLEGEISRTGIDPRRLELEITESAVMQDVDSTVALLLSLKSLGVLLSIDDFGTGHSSLAYLKHLPVDFLKIDQIFIRDLTLEPANAKIVRGAIAMAHSLDLGTVAEGIEDRQSLEILRDMGCQVGQGYYFCRPQPAEGLPPLYFPRPRRAVIVSPPTP